MFFGYYYAIHKLGVGLKENDLHSAWYADYGFNNHKGNCYVMASTFCYMARLLGYEPYFINMTGQDGFQIYYGKSGIWRYIN